MFDIIKEIDIYYDKKRQVFPQYVNRASSAGHPCVRELVYERLNWQQRPLPQLGLQYIFEEGNSHERLTKELLLKLGFEIIEGQRTFEWKELELSGHFEGRLKKGEEIYQFEIKSLNQFDWEKLTDSPDCLKNAKKVWLRKWYAQPQLYLLLDTEKHEPISIMLIKNKQTGQYKQINVPLDYPFAETICKNLETVNKHVTAKSYPERIQDKEVCKNCDFKTLCLPDECSDQINITDSQELLDLLEQRDSLQEFSKEFDEVDETIKEMLKPNKDGTYLVNGKYQIKLSTSDRSSYNVPDDIKSKYMQKVPCRRTNITKIK
jgi:CRISPR/Cas system-associated exonuclease Cas4 (RecB family)